MEYPMIASLVTSGKRAIFPDFPGCLVHCSFKQFSALSPMDSETDFIKRSARDYLAQWIRARLSGGYRIAKPYDYPFPTLKSHEEIWTTEVDPSLDFALELHWARLELGWSVEHMADKLNLTVDGYRRIETGESAPDDEQIAKLNQLQSWINQYELRATASCDGP